MSAFDQQKIFRKGATEEEEFDKEVNDWLRNFKTGDNKTEPTLTGITSNAEGLYVIYTWHQSS